MASCHCSICQITCLHQPAELFTRVDSSTCHRKEPFLTILTGQWHILVYSWSRLSISRVSWNMWCHHPSACALSMDEMKIKSGLFAFSRRTGSFVGFVDLSSANRDMEWLLAEEATDSTNGWLADQGFVFMAIAAFKPSLAVAVAP